MLCRRCACPCRNVSLSQAFQDGRARLALDRLHDKLTAATFLNETDFSNDWAAGPPLRAVQRLAEHWRDSFDWRAHEARLNDALLQFTTRIAVDGGSGELDVHLVHRTSSRDGSTPLLFCHGCASPCVHLRTLHRSAPLLSLLVSRTGPGSFLKVIKILPLLTEP